MSPVPSGVGTASLSRGLAYLDLVEALWAARGRAVQRQHVSGDQGQACTARRWRPRPGAVRRGRAWPRASGPRRALSGRGGARLGNSVLLPCVPSQERPEPPWPCPPTPCRSRAPPQRQHGAPAQLARTAQTATSPRERSTASAPSKRSSTGSTTWRRVRRRRALGSLSAAAWRQWEQDHSPAAPAHRNQLPGLRELQENGSGRFTLNHKVDIDDRRTSPSPPAPTPSASGP